MNEKFMWSYQARDKLYIVEWLAKLVCSMYSDGLSSVTGKAGTWTKRENQYAKTLRDSMTMAGDTKLVCMLLHFDMFWCMSMHGLWMRRETSTIEFNE